MGLLNYTYLYIHSLTVDVSLSNCAYNVSCLRHEASFVAQIINKSLTRITMVRLLDWCKIQINKTRTRPLYRPLTSDFTLIFEMFQQSVSCKIILYLCVEYRLTVYRTLGYVHESDI